jgi:UDP-3-O-[3-hydroxymyristoyl] glucosamine N-acyltransferase
VTLSLRLSLAELADRLGAELVGDGERVVEGIRSLDLAEAEHLSFLHNPKYLAQAAESRAGAILVHSADELPGRDLLVCAQPYLAVARALEIFHPRRPAEPGVHPSAVVADDLQLGDGASIGPLVVVGRGVSVGEGTVIAAGCVVGDGARIGSGVYLHPRVVVEDGCIIGDRCILQSGVVVGSDGYGFATVDGIHHKVPQVGIVVLEDDVEIQANTTIDRATMGETRIGRGTKVDNLVQLAHNVQVGEHCLIVSQVGISGSTKVGNHSVFAGQTGAAGHLELGDQTILTARSAAMKSFPEGGVLAGFPARPQREWLKTQAALGRLVELRKKVVEIEKRLRELEPAVPEEPES